MDQPKRLSEVLAGYLHGTPCPQVFDAMDEAQWNELTSLADRHMVLPILCAAARNTPSFRAFSQSGRLHRRALFMSVEQIARTQTLLALLPKLDGAGVHYVLLKGLVCRMMYSEPELRLSSDEDILLPAAEKERCLQVLAQTGYRREDPNSDEAWRSPDGRLRVEFSYGKMFPQEGKIFDVFNRIFAAALTEHRYEMVFQEQIIYTLQPTENLLYLLAHALKHFVHSGFGLRQLMDIAAFSEHYGAQIDWQRLYRVLNAVCAGLWTRSLFTLCRKWFGLDTKACGAETCGALPEEVDSLWEDILAAGVYGKSTPERLHSSSVTLRAVEEKKHPFLRTCFPSAADLEARYPYVRCRLLLPAAWVHRAVRYTGERIQSRKQGSAGHGSAAIGKQRLELLHEYEIL